MALYFCGCQVTDVSISLIRCPNQCRELLTEAILFHVYVIFFTLLSEPLTNQHRRRVTLESFMPIVLRRRCLRHLRIVRDKYSLRKIRNHLRSAAP